MAKTKFIFGNTSYSIDDSLLSTATDSLKSHLSTVMNGSGATINLGGITYNVDSTKLANETNDFIAHLATIAGSGKKVVVNGVEYSIDSTKTATAVSELQADFGDLQNNSSSQNVAILDEAILDSIILE